MFAQPSLNEVNIKSTRAHSDFAQQSVDLIDANSKEEVDHHDEVIY